MSGDPQIFIRAFGQRASKALGQHFLHDPHVLQRITQACGLKKEDHALEIGPGPGVLTQELLGTGVRLTVMEKDRRAVEFLTTRFTALVGPTAAEQLHVLEADALQLKLAELDPPVRVVVSNLPYNVGTTILLHLLEQPAHSVERMVLMFQKEVALRLCATPGSKAYGSLSLAIAARAQARLLFDVPPGSFVPAPKVNSSVIEVTPRSHPEVPPDLLPIFERVVKASFAARRKTIRNSLSKNIGVLPRGLTGASLLEEAQINPSLRAEALELSDFARLAVLLQKATSST